jgi:hypothetical protein
MSLGKSSRILLHIVRSPAGQAMLEVRGLAREK